LQVDAAHGGAGGRQINRRIAQAVDQGAVGQPLLAAADLPDVGEVLAVTGVGDAAGGLVGGADAGKAEEAAAVLVQLAALVACMLFS
jgi:hypothetical protein